MLSFAVETAEGGRKLTVESIEETVQEHTSHFGRRRQKARKFGVCIGHVVV
jgi:hypothetical protein